VAPGNLQEGGGQSVATLSAAKSQAMMQFGALMALMALCDPNGGLVDVPLSFILKNRLHLNAEEASQFRIFASLPLYFSFLFGLLRDRIAQRPGADRAIILFGALFSLAIYGASALVPLTREAVLAATTLLTICALFIASAQNGAMATFGQSFNLCGDTSVVWNIFTATPTAAAYLLGGELSEVSNALDSRSASQALFLTGATASLCLAFFALRRPACLALGDFADRASSLGVWGELRRFVREPDVRLPLLIWLLWNFAPGSGTALQYHLQNNLKATDWEWGLWNALFTAAFVPAYLLFAALSRRFELKTLLRWGAIVAIPQYAPLLLVDSVADALVVAALIGVLGGVATAAIVDLIIRSCPKGLEGTTMMVASSVYFISLRGGDLVGSYLYDRYGGFSICVAATITVYALILPLQGLLNPRILANREGEVGGQGA
jgi:MFS family permease